MVTNSNDRRLHNNMFEHTQTCAARCVCVCVSCCCFVQPCSTLPTGKLNDARARQPTSDRQLCAFVHRCQYAYSHSFTQNTISGYFWHRSHTHTHTPPLHSTRIFLCLTNFDSSTHLARIPIANSTVAFRHSAATNVRTHTSTISTIIANACPQMCHNPTYSHMLYAKPPERCCIGRVRAFCLCGMFQMASGRLSSLCARPRRPVWLIAPACVFVCGYVRHYRDDRRESLACSHVWSGSPHGFACVRASVLWINSIVDRSVAPWRLCDFIERTTRQEQNKTEVEW